MKRDTFIKSALALGLMTTLKPIRTLAETLKERDYKMPVLFIGHGSPMNAIESNDFTNYWKKLGEEIPEPTAILCISAHWLTKGTAVTAMNNPRTIHDFGGFPQALFDVEYPADGHLDLAKETKALITKTEVVLDHDWGLDHGTWSILKQMYPTANIPTLQLSIDYHQNAQYHYDLGKELAKLRRKGVLIIGSGNMIHNLRMATGVTPNGFDWAEDLNNTFKSLIEKQDHTALINYDKLGHAGKLAIPTPDHYYPLLYTLGLQEKEDDLRFFNDACVYGALSMTSVKIG